jgi:hypothetical protein
MRLPALLLTLLTPLNRIASADVIPTPVLRYSMTKDYTCRQMKKSLRCENVRRPPKR